MGQHARFHIRSEEQLLNLASSLNVRLPFSGNIKKLSEPVTIGSRKAPNRFVAQPMEGFDAKSDGSPGNLAFRRYQRYAKGGFGLIWIEATAVVPEGRSNPGQLWIHRDNMGGFRELVSAIRRAAREVHGRDVVVVMQLTHSGRYSKPTGVPKPIIAHRSPILDPLHQLDADYPVISDDELDRLQDIYVQAARLAREAGVDGVDIKSCHRYLVSELLASFTRAGRYGGSFENRTRFLLETLHRVKDAVPDIFVATRMNAFDAIPHPYGFGVDPTDAGKPDLAEPVELARRLSQTGISVLNVSIGNPYYNPHYGRPFDFPIFGAPVPQEHPLAGIARFIGITAQIQKSVPSIPVVGSGYSWLRHFLPNVGVGVIEEGGASLLGIGRGAFAYPDTPRDVIEKGRMDPEKCCVTCSACTQIMRDGGMTGCVVRDSEIYGPQYRLGRRFAVDRLKEEARRCRECEFPTCARGCPAGVPVPEFIKAFADGDIAGAYRVLRRANVLPEMCAHVCPSEVQCEGKCLEKIFCDRPIPIRDIQLAVCRLARRAGLTGVVPGRETGRRAAVAGGGPAGIAAAIVLIEKGHSVSLFDAGEKLGGTPQAIIPEDRYSGDETEVEAILAPAVKAGRLKVHLRSRLGSGLSIEDLRRNYDAVLLAMGLGKGSALGSNSGALDALTFLRDVKRGRIREIAGPVAVLGGGNTALDAATAALELGARDVYLVYRRSFTEMPAWPDERDRFLAKGGHILILTEPLGNVADADGRIAGLRIRRTELGEPDSSGRRSPRPVPGTESVLAVRTIIEAIGQEVPDEIRQALSGVQFTRKGLIQVAGNGSWRTSLPRVFAAGDIVNGGSTVVQCVAEGMAAASEMDGMLRQDSN